MAPEDETHDNPLDFDFTFPHELSPEAEEALKKAHEELGVPEDDKQT